MSPLNWGQLDWIASSPDKRDAAKWYAGLGLHPILLHGVREDSSCTCGRADCKAVGKHPVQGAWQREPLDLDGLTRALEREWRFNLGLRMGAQPGGFTLLAVDVDGERSLLEPLEREHGPFPETLTAKTPRGWHFLFRLPSGWRGQNQTKCIPGVDVRGERGQIVAPPSAPARGARYQWHMVREPEWLPL